MAGPSAFAERLLARMQSPYALMLSAPFAHHVVGSTRRASADERCSGARPRPKTHEATQPEDEARSWNSCQAKVLVVSLPQLRTTLERTDRAQSGTHLGDLDGQATNKRHTTRL